MLRSRVHRRGFTLVELLIVLTIIALIAGVYLPKYRTARGSAAYQGCNENLKNIAIALQTYANESGQFYPVVLGQIVPNYIASMPICPNCAGVDNYSPSYMVNPPPSAMFTIYCLGPNHLDAVSECANQPWYIMGQGLGP